ncbi:ABC transporter permease [Kineosporia succinea]|uniref:Peptide/nickel transport system permease protein n=1 Tax=Kineosporia succinea TaxID=84632 RepID=A0ABT9PA52_9ACTN|nr:ABC transporter permease [Kineosporia succinea]MDP9829581.1 peptide/nickel transport system permease protein [Kineosporia succinea]
MNKLGRGVAALYLLVLLAALIHPGLVGAGGPNDTDPVANLLAPGAGHWFGTDELGRDVYARVVFGARYSVVIAFLAVALGLAGGIVLGLSAALSGKVVDETLSRVFDLLSAFPSILMALLFSAFFGAGTASLTVAIGLALIPGLARVIRRQAIAIRSSDYVLAARTLGRSPSSIVSRHVLPNAVSPVLLLATIEVGTSVLTVSGLSFVGLGPGKPAPEWGSLLADGQAVIAYAWWPTVFPGLAIVVTIFAITTVGRDLQRRVQGRAS